MCEILTEIAISTFSKLRQASHQLIGPLWFGGWTSEITGDFEIQSRASTTFESARLVTSAHVGETGSAADGGGLGKALLTKRCSQSVAHKALLTVRRVAHGACPRLVASILCERMRSGRCQHVCMLCDPPGSSRRAHLEEEVAAREQQPAGRRDTCARSAARMRGCSSGRSTGAAHARPGRLRRQRGYTRPRPRRTWRSCSTASTCMLSTTPGQKPLHALHVAPCATKASARARAATSTLTRRPRERMSHAGGGTSARRPRAQPACRTTAPSSGSAATDGKHGRRRRKSFWTCDRKLLDVGRAEKASDIKFEKIERGSIPRFCKVLNARSDVSCLLYIWQRYCICRLW